MPNPQIIINYFSGEGLGKNSQGISEPIKASLKFDKTGVGHDPAKEFTSSWWDDAYKQAANNVIIDSEQVPNSYLILSKILPPKMCNKLVHHESKFCPLIT